MHSINGTMRAVYTNGGEQDYNKKGTLKLLPFEVYYNKKLLANILPLAEVADHFCATMGTTYDSSIYVYVNNLLDHQIYWGTQVDQ